MRFSLLKFFQFFDAEHHEIGLLEDLVLNEDTLIPTHIIISGGFFEELMEKKGRKDDIDELISFSDILRIENDAVSISKKLNELEETLKNGKLPFPGLKFSELREWSILIEDEEVKGQLYDVEIHGADTSFIFSISKIQNVLNMDGYYQKIDIVVPISYIVPENGKIHLNINLEMLLTYIKLNVKPKMNGKSLVHYELAHKD